MLPHTRADQKAGRRKKPAKKKKKPEAPALASKDLKAVDITKVQKKSNLLENMKIFVMSFGKNERSKDKIAKLITECGGQVLGPPPLPPQLAIMPRWVSCCILPMGLLKAMHQTRDYRFMQHS